jgi:hypothetical protein
MGNGSKRYIRIIGNMCTRLHRLKSHMTIILIAITDMITSIIVQIFAFREQNSDLFSPHTTCHAMKHRA